MSTTIPLIAKRTEIMTSVIKVTRNHHKPEPSDFMFSNTVVKFSIKVVRIFIKLEGDP
jgi:hypothetical protein